MLGARWLETKREARFLANRARQKPPAASRPKGTAGVPRAAGAWPEAESVSTDGTSAPEKTREDSFHGGHAGGDPLLWTSVGARGLPRSAFKRRHFPERPGARAARRPTLAFEGASPPPAEGRFAPGQTENKAAEQKHAFWDLRRTREEARAEPQPAAGRCPGSALLPRAPRATHLKQQAGQVAPAQPRAAWRGPCRCPASRTCPLPARRAPASRHSPAAARPAPLGAFVPAPALPQSTDPPGTPVPPRGQLPCLHHGGGFLSSNTPFLQSLHDLPKISSLTYLFLGGSSSPCFTLCALHPGVACASEFSPCGMFQGTVTLPA